MGKWKSTLILMSAGTGPVAVALIVLAQFQIIGIATALLLGLLYLLFISSHVWCRIFTKATPPPQEQVDDLPCYEEALKADPPPYYTLYPISPIPNEVKCPPGDIPTLKAATGTDPVDIHFSSELENKADIPPVYRITEKDQRLPQGPILSPLELQMSPPSGASPDFPMASCDTEPVPPSEVEERRTKKKKKYSRIMENIVNPVDLV